MPMQKNINRLSRIPIDTKFTLQKQGCGICVHFGIKSNQMITSKQEFAEFADHYSNTMKDSNELTTDQERIGQVVKNKASKLSCVCEHDQNVHYQYTVKNVDSQTIHLSSPTTT